MTTLPEVFGRARAQQRAALIGYLPAGFPDQDTSVRLVRAMIAAGADVVEVGIPYSDPVMDGPVICQAAEIALAAGATTDTALDVVAATSDGPAAVLVMAYWNLIEQYGPARFAAELAARGGSGVITPDLTPEEGADWIRACDAHALAHVFLAAPSTDDDRLDVISAAASGFVYAASLMGVTGVRGAVDSHAAELVARLRRHTDLPVAVGLGVSTGTQAEEIARYADGVIVGSAFVRRVLEAPAAGDAVTAVAELTRELAAGVRRHGNT